MIRKNRIERNGIGVVVETLIILVNAIFELKKLSSHIFENISVVIMNLWINIIKKFQNQLRLGGFISVLVQCIFPAAFNSSMYIFFYPSVF